MNEKHLFTKHLFALFYKDLTRYVSENASGQISGESPFQIEFIDRDLWQRLTKVLRLRAGQQLILFDQHVNLMATVLDKTFTKKEFIALCIESVQSNQALKPNITLMPCLLKKDAFEDVIYAAAQMGVNKIIPILSDKVQRPWGEKKERERLFNIMVAACEQSKNFFLPEICQPVKIQDISRQANLILPEGQANLKIYFDPSGACFVDLLKKIQESNNQKSDAQKNNNLNIVLFFGPEGGLTGPEEKQLSDLGFETYALTPTILRAREAVIVGLGGVRSAK